MGLLSMWITVHEMDDGLVAGSPYDAQEMAEAESKLV